MRIKLILILLVVACVIIGGCQHSGHFESEQYKQTLPVAEANIIVCGLYKFHEIHGSFPTSKEVFQEFCLESNLFSNSMDFNKVFWKSVDSKKIVVIYTSDDYSFPITVELCSDSSDLVGTIQYKLKGDMQDFMIDQKKDK
jgi:hypothetical protein